MKWKFVTLAMWNAMAQGLEAWKAARQGEWGQALNMLTGRAQAAEVSAAQARDAAAQNIPVDVRYITDAEREAASPADGTVSYTLASAAYHRRQAGAWVQAAEGALTATTLQDRLRAVMTPGTNTGDVRLRDGIPYVWDAASQATAGGTVIAPDPAKAGRWVDASEKYGIKVDSFAALVTADGDWTPAFNAAHARWLAAGGGLITFSSRQYDLKNRFEVPYTMVNNRPKMPSLRWLGTGAFATGSNEGMTARAIGGTIINLLWAGDGTVDRDGLGRSKMLTTGFGQWECSGITFTDEGQSTNPYLLTTNTTIKFHHNAFQGNPGKLQKTADQTVFVFGGASKPAGAGFTPLGEGTADEFDAGFQGYGSSITHNSFNFIRTALLARVFANSWTFANNTTWQGCGSTDPNLGVLVIRGQNDSNFSSGNYIAGNLHEMVGYKRGYVLSRSVNNALIGNGFWDCVEGWHECNIYLADSASQQVVIDAHIDPGVTHIIDDTPASDSRLTHISMTAERPSRIADLRLDRLYGMVTVIGDGDPGAPIQRWKAKNGVVAGEVYEGGVFAFTRRLMIGSGDNLTYLEAGAPGLHDGITVLHHVKTDKPIINLTSDGQVGIGAYAWRVVAALAGKAKNGVEVALAAIGAAGGTANIFEVRRESGAGSIFDAGTTLAGHDSNGLPFFPVFTRANLPDQPTLNNASGGKIRYATVSDPEAGKAPLVYVEGATWRYVSDGTLVTIA